MINGTDYDPYYQKPVYVADDEEDEEDDEDGDQEVVHMTEQKTDTKQKKPRKPKHEPFTDCRAYLPGKRSGCAGLTEMFCVTQGKCKFYKPKE